MKILKRLCLRSENFDRETPDKSINDLFDF